MKEAKNSSSFFENKTTLSELLTINELIALLKVKESFIRALIYQRRIPYIKVGRLVRFKGNVIERWLLQCSTKDSPTGGKV